MVSFAAAFVVSDWACNAAGRNRERSASLKARELLMQMVVDRECSCQHDPNSTRSSQVFWVLDRDWSIGRNGRVRCRNVNEQVRYRATCSFTIAQYALAPPRT